MADFVMVRLPGELAERIKRTGAKREPFVRDAVVAALGRGAEETAKTPEPQPEPEPEHRRGPVRINSAEQARIWALERQRKLNKPKGL